MNERWHQLMLQILRECHREMLTVDESAEVWRRGFEIFLDDRKLEVQIIEQQMNKERSS